MFMWVVLVWCSPRREDLMRCTWSPVWGPSEREYLSQFVRSDGYMSQFVRLPAVMVQVAVFQACSAKVRMLHVTHYVWRDFVELMRLRHRKFRSALPLDMSSMYVQAVPPCNVTICLPVAMQCESHAVAPGLPCRAHFAGHQSS